MKAIDKVSALRVQDTRISPLSARLYRDERYRRWKIEPRGPARR
jgi:hypothetical protein